MCPLRVFVILFSIIIAAFCLFPGADSKPQKKRTWRELIFDFATGRYLYFYLYGEEKSKGEEVDDEDSDDEDSDDEEEVIPAYSMATHSLTSGAACR